MPLNTFTEQELLDACEQIQQYKKYSIYITYRLYSSDFETIHCNYIKRFDVSSIEDVNVHLRFPPNSFRFLKNGFEATSLSILANIVENEYIDGVYRIKQPKSNEWRIYDTGVEFNTREELIEKTITQSLNNYEEDDLYNLSYLDYPEKDVDKLCFGDETFFLGNVDAKIEGLIYSSDISIKLPLEQFNYSTNKTWDGDSSVYITEIGIYDNENNLVAIGKLSEPLEKNGKISRTILFSLDF